MLWCICMGLGYSDTLVESHTCTWPQQNMWGRKSSMGHWPVSHVIVKSGETETHGSRTALFCCSYLSNTRIDRICIQYAPFNVGIIMPVGMLGSKVIKGVLLGETLRLINILQKNGVFYGSMPSYLSCFKVESCRVRFCHTDPVMPHNILPDPDQTPKK